MTKKLKMKYGTKKIDSCYGQAWYDGTGSTARQEQQRIGAKEAYSKWMANREFDKISYNPGAEEVWIAGYEYAIALLQEGRK